MEIIYKDLPARCLQLLEEISIHQASYSHKIRLVNWDSYSEANAGANIQLTKVNPAPPLVISFTDECIRNISEQTSKENDLSNNQTNSNCIQEDLYNNGMPYFLTWNRFIADPTRYIHLCLNAQNVFEGVKKTRQNVLLAFLPPYLRRILAGIFSLYGYGVRFAHTPEELSVELSGELDYLLFDIDLGQNANERAKTLKTIQCAAKSKNSLAVNVIKNFEKGSLFDDLSSPVKGFCDLILSPEEYVIFLTRFLYSNEIDNQLYVQKEKADKIIERLNIAGASLKPLQNIFNGLKNPKKTYYAAMRQEKDPSAFEQASNGLNAQLKPGLIQWMIEYIVSKEQNRERSYFTLVPEQSPAVYTPALKTT